MPMFDEAGAPLNAAARLMLERHGSPEFVPGGDSATVFHKTPAVDIAEGTWKYVLMEIRYEGERRLIVRSLKDLHYHAQIFDLTLAHLEPYGISCRVIGGGRIRRDSQNNVIDVYGFSKTFGRSPGCNERTADIVRSFVRGTYRVRWSDAEGY